MSSTLLDTLYWYASLKVAGDGSVGASAIAYVMPDDTVENNDVNF